MKLIGVMGNAGAGKSTFSNFLGECKNIGVIHVDDLVGEVKNKYFKFFVDSKQKSTNTNKNQNPKLKAGAKKFFYKNSFLFNSLMKLRSALVRKSIDEKIKEFTRQGKKVIVIDDWVLSTHKELYSRLNKVYYLERAYLDRREGLRNRDDLSKLDVKIADMPYALELITKPKDEKVVTIKNKGDLRELRQIANEEYEKLGVQTFDEKYKVELEHSIPTISSINKGIQKVKTVREGSFEESFKLK